MQPEPRHLILNLLLGAADRRLAAREAVVACALFGIRENSVRVTLARLSAAGLLEAADRGEYRLGPGAAQLADEVAIWRSAESRVRNWDGAWIVAYVGDLGRSNRVALRARARALGMLGLRELDRGLFLRPDNLAGGVEAVRERLLRLGLQSEAAVFVAHDFDSIRARRAVALWNGRALTLAYRETRARLEGWLARAGALALEVAARESFVLGDAAIRQLVFDPLLPAPLIDVDARRDFLGAVLRFDAAGHAIWHRFLRDGTGRRASTRVRPASDRVRPARGAPRAAPTATLEIAS